MGRQDRQLQQYVAMGFVCHIVAQSVALQEGQSNIFLRCNTHAHISR